MKIKNMFKDGLFKNNPVLSQLVGLCSVLAVSSTLQGALGMAAAVTIVLMASNFVVSLLRNFIPNEIRIPAYIVIIATFVTLIEMVLKAYLPSLFNTLGIFLPLIVVNCVILARAESFASKNTVGKSIIDGLVNGLGYGLVIVILAFIRELFGTGSIYGIQIFPAEYSLTILKQAPSAFILLGFLVAFTNHISNKKEEKKA